MIHVINNYYIDKDEFQYMVKKDSGKKLTVRGKEYPKYELVGCFITLPAAIEKIVDRLVSEKLSERTYELKEALDIIKEESCSLRELIIGKLQ